MLEDTVHVFMCMWVGVPVPVCVCVCVCMCYTLLPKSEVGIQLPACWGTLYLYWCICRKSCTCKVSPRKVNIQVLVEELEQQFFILHPTQFVPRLFIIWCCCFKLLTDWKHPSPEQLWMSTCVFSRYCRHFPSDFVLTVVTSHCGCGLVFSVQILQTFSIWFCHHCHHIPLWMLTCVFSRYCRHFPSDFVITVITSHCGCWLVFSVQILPTFSIWFCHHCHHIPLWMLTCVFSTDTADIFHLILSSLSLHPTVDVDLCLQQVLQTFSIWFCHHCRHIPLWMLTCVFSRYCRHFPSDFVITVVTSRCGCWLVSSADTADIFHLILSSLSSHPAVNVDLHFEYGYHRHFPSDFVITVITSHCDVDLSFQDRSRRHLTSNFVISPCVTLTARSFKVQWEILIVEATVVFLSCASILLQMCSTCNIHEPKWQYVLL